MSAPVTRLAILEADRLFPHAAEKYGRYGGVFVDLFDAASEKLALPDGSLEISLWNIQEDMYPQLEDIDAILITGSRADAYDDHTPWIKKLVEFTRRVLFEQTRVRVIGVCFGHQVIGRALGVEVKRNEKGWEAGVLPIPLLPRGKELFGRDSLNIFLMHRDVVTEVPEGVERLGQTDKCAVQGMYAPKRLISVQGHPEHTSDIQREILDTRRKLGIFSDETYREIVGRLELEQEGVAVATVFIRFMQER